jgi:trk system potassium uptake protein TrkH
VREAAYLRRRYRAILSSTGAILGLTAGLFLVPLLVLITHPDQVKNGGAFIWPAALMGGLGLALWRLFRPAAAPSLTIAEGGVIVLLSWVAVIVFSAWPFMAVLGLGFSPAVFESVSGWTTTGLSVVDVTRAGEMILLWRSTMQLAGGAGLAIIMMSAIIGPTGAGISAAEGRGDQLVPQVRQSARLVLLIYAGYVIAGVAAYILVGLTPFEAVNYAFAAVSTGGFATWPKSIGHWDSLAVEAVTMPLMILGNLSFVTAWLLLRGRFRPVGRNGEIRLQAVIIPVFTAAVLIFTCLKLYPDLGKSLRVALFETVSALTTTGFQSVTYQNWNSFGVAALTVLMLIGGGTCSTAGGIKQFRIYILWRLIVWEFRRLLSPRKAVIEQAVWEGQNRVFLSDARIRQISFFVFLYLATYTVGVLILCACGFSLRDSLFEFASALGTVGLSVGVTSAQMPGVALWAETAAMFLGRLEFIVIFVSLVKLGRDTGRMLARK